MPFHNSNCSTHVVKKTESARKAPHAVATVMSCDVIVASSPSPEFCSFSLAEAPAGSQVPCIISSWSDISQRNCGSAFKHQTGYGMPPMEVLTVHSTPVKPISRNPDTLQSTYGGTVVKHPMAGWCSIICKVEPVKAWKGKGAFLVELVFVGQYSLGRASRFKNLPVHCANDNL